MYFFKILQVFSLLISIVNKDVIIIIIIRLWQREQLAILVSRVEDYRDIIFVGDKEETRHAVERLLACTSKWDVLVDHYIDALDISRQMQLPRAREV